MSAHQRNLTRLNAVQGAYSGIRHVATNILGRVNTVGNTLNVQQHATTPVTDYSTQLGQLCLRYGTKGLIRAMHKDEQTLQNFLNNELSPLFYRIDERVFHGQTNLLLPITNDEAKTFLRDDFKHEYTMIEKPIFSSTNVEEGKIVLREAIKYTFDLIPTVARPNVGAHLNFHSKPYSRFPQTTGDYILAAYDRSVHGGLLDLPQGVYGIIMNPNEINRIKGTSPVLQNPDRIFKQYSFESVNVPIQITQAVRTTSTRPNVPLVI